MIDLMREILKNNPDINGFKIMEQNSDSLELFFIKKELDMNRAKKVHHYLVTVYKDFEDNGLLYKGSATVSIHPTMSETQISIAIAEAACAAGLVKNTYYPMVQPSNQSVSLPPSNCKTATLEERLPLLTEAIFKKDAYQQGWINSAELFLNQHRIRIINSAGVDLTREAFWAELEVITNWREGSMEVELFREIKFAAFEPEFVAGTIDELLTYGREKALARPTPGLKKHTVLLTGEPVREFFQYYYFQTAAQSVYEGTSVLKMDEFIQGTGTTGDLLSFRLDPWLPNSTESSPFDEDGVSLQTVEIVRDGRLLRFWGDHRHSSYLAIEPTGIIRNMVVGGGSQSIADLKSDPYIELVAFSDFQMDSLTGDFGGEIRLGWYFDGKETIPVTGGSISGNIKDVQSQMYLSRELQTENAFVGPKTIKLFNVSVTGA